MTPAERSAHIASAKDVAILVASCAPAGIRPDHLLASLSRDELTALVGILAAAADPVRLRAVVSAPDGAHVTDRDVMLLKAHAHAVALRKADRPVPFRVRVLDGEYHRQRRQVRASVAEAGDKRAA